MTKRYIGFFGYLSSLLLTLYISTSYSQVNYYHQELEWKTIETKHFLVHFHNGSERTGQEVARIAESIYQPITSMYAHEPDQRVSFIIRDHDDYSNGAAYFYDNRIEIWAPALDYELRGTHPWLWNVVTHEFTHIVQIQTAMKMGRKIPGIYFQWLGYESERRPDVLYGYPNVLVSYPWSGFVVPSWFAEGTAQYNNPSLKYDYWDSHRDMILRMYMIEGNPLSWEEMATFGKNSLGNESSYNAGFSIIEYIAETYGTEKLEAISRQLAKQFRITIDGAIEAVLRKPGIQIYKEWKEEKIKKYSRIADSISTSRREGEIIEKDGFGNFYPAFSSDGSKIAFISNKGEDYFSISSVYLYDCSTHTTKKIISKVRSSLSFSPDNNYLYYSQRTKDNPHWSEYYDLYRFNLITEKEERLSNGLRAWNPKLSCDGRKIIYVFGSDGTLNIGVCDSDGKNNQVLTKFNNGEQVYTPVWSPDGRQIAFGYSTDHNQSVMLIDSSGENQKIYGLEGDCRNPFFVNDSILAFSWNRGGIYNIYKTNLYDSSEQQLTNVLGGAFLPTFSVNGDLAFVSYTSSGYKLALCKADSLANKSQIIQETFSTNVISFNSNVSKAIEIEKLTQKKESAETHQNYAQRTYKPVFTSLTLIPLLRVDTYNEASKGIDVIKPGLYFTSTEVLDKMDIFGGGAINRKLERDLFLIVEYRDRLPLLYQLGLEPVASAELYNITRSRHVSFELPGNPQPLSFETDVTYNLLEFDFSLRHPVIIENCEAKFLYTRSRYSQDFGSWFYPSPGPGSIPASRSTYLIGNSISLQIKYNGILPTLDKDINPIGRTISLKYFHEMNEFNPTDSTEEQNGFRGPVYTNYDFDRLELNWNEHYELPFSKHTISFSLNAAGILGDSIDEFFDYYAGGFIGMRGYPFYAIGGNRSLIFNTTYRFPIATQLNFRILQFYFTKLYGSVFCDIGNAWTGIVPSFEKWKRDVGFEFRLESFSFYAYPTRIFFSGAYGLDRFTRKVNDINIRTVQYGKEWRFYLGILFGFELNDIRSYKFNRLL